MADTERLLGITLDLMFSIFPFLLGLGSDWVTFETDAAFPCFLFSVFLRPVSLLSDWVSSHLPSILTSVSSIKRTWINLVFGICFTVPQEGPCSPATISHTIPAPIFDAKWLVHASLMFAIVSSLPLKSTNSLGPILVYFCCLAATSELNRCTVSSSLQLLSSSAWKSFHPLYAIFFFLRPSHSAWWSMAALGHGGISFCFSFD